MNVMSQHEPKRNFAESLDRKALRGKRLGVSMDLVRFQEGAVTSHTSGGGTAAEPVFMRALTTLRSLGAEIVDVQLDDIKVFTSREWIDEVWPAEFKEGLENYLESVE